MPASAFRGPRGPADLTEHPDHDRREWLDSRIASLRDHRARYLAVKDAMNSRERIRPKPRADSFTRELRDAHRAWPDRGRTGPGRLSIANADAASLGLGSMKLGGAWLTRFRFDFAKADFSDFSGAVLTECSAIATGLGHSVLDDAVLTRCNLERAHLGLTQFRDAVILGGRFRWASADRGSWNRIRILGADLRDVRFGDCVLDGATFENCDLRKASFACITPALDTLCSTRNTTFLRCDLRGADFEQRRLDGTRFIDCNFAGVRGRPRIEGPCVVDRPDFSAAGDGSDLRPADAVFALWGKPRA